MTALQIWQWTLTKEAVTPCFVRDVLALRQSTDRDVDFFWLGHTPCRTILLVGMVVAIQVYDKRTIYTIDDGTAVIDCVLRHPLPSLPAPVSSKSTAGTSAKSLPQRSPTKKQGLAKDALDSIEPPPPITEPGYPVRVVGKVIRHYGSNRIHADTIEPCPSSLDEIAHLERVIELHKSKYCKDVPFALPPKPTTSAPPESQTSTLLGVDSSVFSGTTTSLPPGNTSASYTLPTPPCLPIPLRKPSPRTPRADSTCGHSHVPSSPTASSIASSTPSSPCKPSSPVKACEGSQRPKLRHPSRLHTCDLTTNTFRLYVKHYMDNAPPPFQHLCASPSRGTRGGFATPRKPTRDEAAPDESTPRPRPCTDTSEPRTCDESMVGFTLSHLRRVPELALLATRIVRAEGRKRHKAEREKEKQQGHLRTSSVLASSGGISGNGRGSSSAPTTTDPPRKKVKRLFSWAVIKLYEEGSIILWDGDVQPLPVPPAIHAMPSSSSIGLWNNDTITNDSYASCRTPSKSGTWDGDISTSASVLYTASASASLYSDYHAPRRKDKTVHGRDVEDDDVVDPDADPAYLSDPTLDEEAYVPLTSQFLAGHVREAVGALRRGTGRRRAGASANSRSEKEPTAEEVLTYMKRMDARWARVGVWAVEDALEVIKVG